MDAHQLCESDHEVYPFIIVYCLPPYVRCSCLLLLSTFLGRYPKGNKRLPNELGGWLAISLTGTKVFIKVHGGIWVFMLFVSICCYWTKGRCGWSSFCGCVCDSFVHLRLLVVQHRELRNHLPNSNLMIFVARRYRLKITSLPWHSLDA